MAQIGTLLTGAGNVTTIPGLSQMDEYIVIGDVDTANPLQGLQVDVNGVTLINITVQALITSYSKWLMEMTGSTVGLMLKLSTGRVKGNTTLRLTNSGATTPAIYSFSDSDNGLPFVVATEVILAGSYSDFNDFTSIHISAPANIQQAIVTFENDFQTVMAMPELCAYFALTNNAEADGQLGGVVVIDNSRGNIKNVRLFATGANLNALKVQIPE